MHCTFWFFDLMIVLTVTLLGSHILLLLCSERTVMANRKIHPGFDELVGLISKVFMHGLCLDRVSFPRDSLSQAICPTFRSVSFFFFFRNVPRRAIMVVFIVLQHPPITSPPIVGWPVGRQQLMPRKLKHSSCCHQAP